MIVLHPAWVTRAGIGDIVRHFQTRGFDVSNTVGSRFFRLEPPPWRPEPTPPPRTELDNILAIFRRHPGGNR